MLPKVQLLELTVEKYEHEWMVVAIGHSPDGCVHRRMWSQSDWCWRSNPKFATTFKSPEEAGDHIAETIGVLPRGWTLPEQGEH